MAKEPPVTGGEIAELLNPEILEAHIRNRVINRRGHPRLSLAILNYGQKAQFEQLWDSVTMRCRGLIYDFDSGDLVAVPFAKFFNYDTSWREETFPENLPTWEPEITAKLDGSLGILWRFAGQHGIATRGSFDSLQAQWATKWFDAHTTPSVFPQGWTPLFEIIYPENRIIVKYDFEGMILLGCVNNSTGQEMTHDQLCVLGASAGIQVVKRVNGNIQELTLLDSENEEGFVATWHREDQPPLRVKIKFETYFRLHKLLTGTSPKRVWEFLRDGQDVSAMINDTPNHFREWVLTWERDLKSAYAEVEDAAKQMYADACGGSPLVEKNYRTDGRKQFALWATSPERKRLSSVLFKMLDGESYSDVIWKQLRPNIEGLGTFKAVDE